MAAGVYVHIPFCRNKCVYCDFTSYANLDSLYEDYVLALCREIAFRASWASPIAFDTIFLGGGTPTVLRPSLLATILQTCRSNLALADESECTIEANPGTVDAQGLELLREEGFNRLSLGVQSLDERELALLGRIHNAREAIEAYRLARQVGFDNINIDLIYGLPLQSLKQWRQTLQRTLNLEPDHLSLYALTVEEGTALSHMIQAGHLPAPDDDLAAEMYELAEEILAPCGLIHYEISNWASSRLGFDDQGVPALACAHNIKYWRNQSYWGLGVAAHSYDGCLRTANTTDVADYIARISRGEPATVDSEETDRPRQMAETMMLGLRLLQGIRWTDWSQRFGVSLEQAYGPQIEELVSQGLLEADARGIRLTTQGHLLGNQVFAAFMP